MNAYAPVTIDELKALAESHGLHEIAVWHFREGEGQHVTTYGDPLGHSLRAAEAGNAIKEAALWPEALCHALPMSLVPVVSAWETQLAAEIRSGTLHKGTVLAVLMMLRDCIGARDPQLAEQLTMPRCEAATPGEAQ